MDYASRIAPTPSGFLHTGNLYNFLLIEKIVRLAGGNLRLRIDDGDEERLRLPYLDAVFDTLHWIGIAWDEGPVNSEDHLQHYTQQLRLRLYQAALQKLVRTGQVFACTCSRKQIKESADEWGQYNGACLHKNIPLDTPGVAWRIITPPGNSIRFIDHLTGEMIVDLHQHLRHFVVRRSNDLPSYQVASFCDDVAYGINLIVRGEDLLYSTAAQLHLANLSGEASFLSTTFYHHPLLTDAEGRKLSKSAGSLSQPIQQTNITAAAIRHNFTEWSDKILQMGF